MPDELPEPDSAIVPRTASLLLVVSILLFACSWQGPQKRMSDVAMARKSASAAERSALDPTPRGLVADLTTRTAILFRNADAVAVELLEGDRHRIEWRATGKIQISAAVPVAEDGYFLTAAHSVEAAASLTLVAWIEAGGFRGPRAVPARIVWTAGKAQRPDIAVLHAELPPVVPFAMAVVPAAEDAVAATGASNWLRMAKRWGSDPALGSFGTIAFGRVLGAGRMIDGRRQPPHRLIRHTAPTIRGDSGGALVDERGELVGINSTVHPPWWLAWLPYIGLHANFLMGGAGSSSEAVRPETDWLTDLIEADRRQMRHTPLEPPHGGHPAPSGKPDH